MFNWLKRKFSQQGDELFKEGEPPQDAWERPFVRDVNALLQPIDLNWEPQPDRHSDWDKWESWSREEAKRSSLMVDRNLLGQELEKGGDISTAVSLYEANIRDAFDGNFPYDRLAIIYRREGQLEDEIRVLARGIEVFSGYQGPRSDVQPKLAAFQKRLARAKTLLEKNR